MSERSLRCLRQMNVWEISDAGETALHFGHYYVSSDRKGMALRRVDLEVDTDMLEFLQLIGPMRGLVKVVSGQGAFNQEGNLLIYFGRDYYKAFIRAINVGFVQAC